MPQAVLGKIGGGIKSGAKAVSGGVASGAAWIGRGVVGGVEKAWNNPQVQAAAVGCAQLGLETAIVGGALMIVGGPEVTAAELGASCGLGAAAGYFDSRLEGSGQSFKDLDTFNGVYRLYKSFGY